MYNDLENVAAIRIALNKYTGSSDTPQVAIVFDTTVKEEKLDFLATDIKLALGYAVFKPESTLFNLIVSIIGYSLFLIAHMQKRISKSRIY